MNKKLLFEIGSEEIPARFVPNSIKQLKVITENKLKEYRIDFESINVFATPRRLTLYIDSINTTQSDLELTIKGPSIKAAFDNNKNPTRALEGFMRSNSVEIKDTFTKLSGKSEYIYAKKIEKGLPTKEILEKILPEILFSIKFSKTMKWGSYTIKYPRPIRWVVAIFGTDTLNIEIGNIKASNITFGHRTLSNKNVNLTPDTYFDKLKIANVIVNHNERKNMIRYQIENLSKSENADAQIDEELLEEVNYLVEYPTAFIGNFDQKYLNLPKEVVITPMKEHQRYFPLFKNGKLINKFIGVRNGDEKSIDIVKTGNERVLKARLEDAQFFYNEDKKIRLEERVNELKTIVYQEKLGTVYDKVLRVSKISDYIANELHLENEKKDMLKKTTLISKADLVTLMVNEFDELQGLMGMYYAIENNIDKEIAKALYTQYLPKFSGDNVPKDTLGMIMSISDRVDTIVGSFGIGTVPTGSNDPYGLRRQALGMISIILENNLNLDINKILRFSSHLYNNNVITNIDSVINEIDIFIRQRLRVLFIEKGYRYDIVDS
ncbi:MAG: glycine--tRNA ligase subunit beta, partial [Clostridiales bacterium]